MGVVAGTFKNSKDKNLSGLGQTEFRWGDVLKLGIGENYDALFVICDCRIREKVLSSRFALIPFAACFDLLPVEDWNRSTDFCLIFVFFTVISDTTNYNKFKVIFFALLRIYKANGVEHLHIHLVFLLHWITISLF